MSGRMELAPNVLRACAVVSLHPYPRRGFVVRRPLLNGSLVVVAESSLSSSPPPLATLCNYRRAATPVANPDLIYGILQVSTLPTRVFEPPSPPKLSFSPFRSRLPACTRRQLASIFTNARFLLPTRSHSSPPCRTIFTNQFLLPSFFIILSLLRSNCPSFPVAMFPSEKSLVDWSLLEK